MIRFPLWLVAAQSVLAVSAALALVSCCVGPDYRPADPPKLTRFTAQPLPPQTEGAQPSQSHGGGFKSRGCGEAVHQTIGVEVEARNAKGAVD